MYSTDQKAAVGPLSFANVADLLGSQLARHGNSVATRHDVGDRYVDTTYAEVLANSRALAHWFLARGAPQRWSSPCARTAPNGT